MPKKVRVEVLTKDGRRETRNVDREGNKLLMAKSWHPRFRPSDFIEEKKGLIFRTTRKFLVVGEGMLDCLHWNEKKPSKKDKKGAVILDALQLYYTFDEMQEIIKKEIAKSKVSVQPISLKMFIVMVAFLGMLLVISLASAGKLGVFAT